MIAYLAEIPGNVTFIMWKLAARHKVKTSFKWNDHAKCGFFNFKSEQLFLFLQTLVYYSPSLVSSILSESKHSRIFSGGEMQKLYIYHHGGPQKREEYVGLKGFFAKEDHRAQIKDCILE